MARARSSLRAALIAEGLRQLREVGARRLSLRAVTAASGVTPMAAYRHFASRQELLAAIAARAMHAFARRLGRASREPDAKASLLATCVAYLRFAHARPAEFELLFGADIADRRRHPELWAAGDEAFGVLLGVVERCQAVRLINPRLDRLACAASLWVHVHGLSSLSRHWPTSGRVPTPAGDSELVAAEMSRLLDGLGEPGGAR